MDLVHHIYRLMLGGKLYFSPLADKVGRVLELGTGTGIWAMDFAEWVIWQLGDPVVLGLTLTLTLTFFS